MAHTGTVGGASTGPSSEEDLGMSSFSFGFPSKPNSTLEHTHESTLVCRWRRLWLLLGLGSEPTGRLGSRPQARAELRYELRAESVSKIRELWRVDAFQQTVSGATREVGLPGIVDFGFSTGCCPPLP